MRVLERLEIVLGHVHDDLGFALVRDLDDRLARGDDLADLEAQARDDAAARCAQDGVLHLVASQVELARLGLGRRVSRLQSALRVFVVEVAD
jgi:hypothetical protein